MAKFALLALTVAFALVGVARSIPFEEKDLSSEESLWNLYERWRSHYTVSRDLDEKKERFTVFKKNVKFIHEFNQKNATYKLGLNKFGDLTNEEFRNTYTGLKKPESRKGDGAFMCKHASSVPDFVDWRTKGVVAPVKDQGQCGACWAFSAIAAVESANAIVTGEGVRLSEQQLVDCVDTNRGCNGGLLDNAFEFIMQNGGVATEAAYPYTARQGICYPKVNSPVVTIDGYQDVPANDEVSLMYVVANQVVSVGIEGSGDAFQYYKEGVFYGPCGTNLDHAITLVGYGTTRDGTDYWIAKNSWGTDWGEDGYIRIQRGVSSQGICGIAMVASFPIKYRQTSQLRKDVL